MFGIIPSLSKDEAAPPILAPAAGSLLLAGCISASNSAAISDLQSNWRTDARVESVTLQRSPDLKVSPEFDALFTARVQARMATCATGSRALRFERGWTS